MLGEEAFHPDTRALLAYGRALAGGQTAAKKGRADHLLERLFVIERAKDGRLPVRSFGSELIALFGRDLRDQDFGRLWLAPDLALVNALIESAASANEPAIARVVAESACGRKLGAEILVTPLRVSPSLGDRFLCLFQPLGGEGFLEGRPLSRFKLGALYPPEAKTPKGPQLVVVND